MSFTETSLLLRAKQRLADKGGDLPATIGPRLLALIPDALERTARIVADDVKRRHLLRRTFTLTPSAGQVDLTAFIVRDANNGLLLDFFHTAELLHPDSPYLMQRLDSYDQLVLNREGTSPAQFLYWYRQSITLRTRDLNKSLTGLSGDISASASYIPVITDTRLDPLQDDVLDQLVNLAQHGADDSEMAA